MKADAILVDRFHATKPAEHYWQHIIGNTTGKRLPKQLEE